MNQKRLVLIVGGALAALLIALLIVGISILNAIRADAEQRNYEACMARFGFEVDAPPPALTDEDAYINSLVEAAERCGR